MPGAGILFTSIHKGELCFLMGRENKYCINGRFTYCDFGGGTDDDENYKETAARECSEEMRGFLGNRSDLLKLLKNIPNSKKQSVQYPMYIDNGEHPRVYRIFIIPMPYLPYLPVLFNQSCEITSQYLQHTLLRKSKILEKDRMKWVFINDNHTPLRRFFKQSMEKIRQQKNEIMNYVKINLFHTKRYFDKYTMTPFIVHHKTTKKSLFKHSKSNYTRKNRRK